MSTSAKPLVVGLAGTLVGGKDTLATYMENEYSYTHISTGDLLRKVAQKERGSVERPILQEVGKEYRHRFGPGALVLLALENPRPLVVTGLRSLGEAKVIKAAGGTLMFIDAPLEVRYQRMQNRKRDHETEISLEEFTEREQKEWHAGDSDEDFNLQGIRDMSDIILDNDMPMDEFLVHACKLLGIR